MFGKSTRSRSNDAALLAVLSFLVPAGVAADSKLTPRQQISLNGQWILKPLGAAEAIPAKLPGDFKNPGKGWYAGNMPKQVQEFIFEQGELPDPHDTEVDVLLNGEKIAACNNMNRRWCASFRFDFTGATRPGRNELVVEVTNTWRNQLIHDLTRPEGQKKTWTTNPPRNPSETPSPSGLLGPVVLRLASAASFR